MQLCVGWGACYPMWLRRVYLRCHRREPIVLCASPRGAQGCFPSMPLLPRQRCPAKTVSVWRWYATWPDGREGYALPSVSTFSTEGSALRLPVALQSYLAGTLPETSTNAISEKGRWTLHSGPARTPRLKPRGSSGIRFLWRSTCEMLTSNGY